MLVPAKLAVGESSTVLPPRLRVTDMLLQLFQKAMQEDHKIGWESPFCDNGGVQREACLQAQMETGHPRLSAQSAEVCLPAFSRPPGEATSLARIAASCTPAPRVQVRV